MGSRVAIIFPSVGREPYELAFIHCFPTLSFDPGSCFDDRLVNLEGVDGVPLVKHGSSSSNFGRKIPNKKMHEFSSPIFFCSCKWKLDSSQQKLRGKTLYLSVLHTLHKKNNSKPQGPWENWRIDRQAQPIFVCCCCCYLQGGASC